MRSLSRCRFFMGIMVMILSLDGGVVLGEDRTQVPSALKGVWQGSVVSESGDPFDVSLAIVGGASDKPMGIMIVSESSYCLHTIEIQPSKKSGKGSSKRSQPDSDSLFLAKTKTTKTEDFGACLEGSFTFDLTRSDRLLVDASWTVPEMDDDYSFLTDSLSPETWNFVLVRADDGVASEECKASPPSTPASKLRETLCQQND